MSALPGQSACELPWLIINDRWIQETFVIGKTSMKKPKILPGWVHVL